MNGHSSTRAIVETGVLTAISIILIAFSFYMPIFYFIGVFLWPLPTAMVYVKHNIRYALSSVMITAVITSILANPISALSITLVYGGLGIALGYSIKNKESTFFTLLLMFAVTFTATLVSIKAFSLFIGQDIIGETMKVIEQSMNIMKDSYVRYGVPKEQVDELLKSLYDLDTLRTIVPAVFVIYSVIVSFFIYFIANKVFRRLGFDIEEIKPFSEFYIPTQLSYALMIIAVIGYIVSSSGYKNGEQYLYNSYLVFSFVFALDGLAVLVYFLKIRRFPKFIIFIIAAFLIISPLSQIMFYVGLVDYIFNFRKLDIKRNSRIGKL